MSLDAGNDPNRRSKIEDEHEREDDSEANYALGPNEIVKSKRSTDPPGRNVTPRDPLLIVLSILWRLSGISKSDGGY
jgi:hypothetical protein